MTQRRNSRELIELKNFGSNPGTLACWLYLPSILAPKTPLVVVLHGCTQNAATYDHGSGWSKLAEEKGFAVLFPEQQRANNANLCFNWFEPDDIRRDAGEALSIRQMIRHVVESHGMDPGKIFVTGLSAGGAMANVMPVTYPELFAGGAIIGGLPYGSKAQPTAIARSLSLSYGGDRFARGRRHCQGFKARFCQHIALNERHAELFERRQFISSFDPFAQRDNC